MKLLKEIRACSICKDVLPCPPRPIIQMSSHSKVLIIGQAPGITAHNSGIPWNDASGIRLRHWLNFSDKYFYNAHHVAIVPMGFCYPGKSPSGDLPPRPECSIRWMDTVLYELKNVRLKIIIGSYAANYFFEKNALVAQIKEYALNDTPFVLLPHPSPRNNIWLAKNQWFENDCLPAIRKKILRTGLIPKV